MSMTDKEKRGFLPEDPREQVTEAYKSGRAKYYYRKALESKDIEDVMRFELLAGGASKRQAWRDVRDSFGNRTRNVIYLDSDRMDDFTYVSDINIVREVARQEKKRGRNPRLSVAENTNPQLSDLPLPLIHRFKGLVFEIISTCTSLEKRLFVFILVENEIDYLLELFADGELPKDFTNVVEELYTKMDKEEEIVAQLPNRRLSNPLLNRIGKHNFVARGNRRTYGKVLKSFREKIHPLFFPLLFERGDYEIQNKVLKRRQSSETRVRRDQRTEISEQ